MMTESSIDWFDSQWDTQLAHGSQLTLFTLVWAMSRQFILPPRKFGAEEEIRPDRFILIRSSSYNMRMAHLDRHRSLPHARGAHEKYTMVHWLPRIDCPALHLAESVPLSPPETERSSNGSEYFPG